jgi:hypothetical protein
MFDLNTRRYPDVGVLYRQQNWSPVTMTLTISCIFFMTRFFLNGVIDPDVSDICDQFVVCVNYTGDQVLRRGQQSVTLCEGIISEASQK